MIYPNQDTLERKGDTINNYAGTTGVDWDHPRQTGMCGQSTHKGNWVLKDDIMSTTWGSGQSTKV